jgi:hypothetical protein
MAHSVIPHHHHKSAEEEIQAHHHSDSDHHHGHKHHHEHNQGDHSNEDGHLFFLTHDFNAEFLVHAFHSDDVIKHKKQKVADTEMECIFSLLFTEHLIFHPPQDDTTIRSFTFTAVSLRAPPIA